MEKKLKSTVLLIMLILSGCVPSELTQNSETLPWAYEPLYQSTEDAAPRWTADGNIIWYSYRYDHSAEIMLMDAYGANITRITEDAHDQWWPSLSPDMQKLVFSSDEHLTQKFNGGNIYIMNIDGTDKKQITFTGEGIWNTNPIFSPDGTKILYNADWRGRSGDAEIFVVNPDGSGNKNLSDNDQNDSYPSWSPDGSKIGYVTSTDTDSRLMVMNSDGKEKKMIRSFEGGRIYSTSWVNDETVIITLEHEGKAASIEAIDLITGDTRTLLANPHGDYFAEYSSKTHKIVFTSRRNGQNDVFTIDLDGSNPKNLTQLASYNQKPDVSGDGTILFVSRQEGNQDIYRMSVKGDEIQNLTGSTDLENYPKLSPDGSKVLYSKSNSGSKSEIWIKELNSDKSYPLIADTFDNDEPCWSPSGKKFVFRSNRDGNNEIYEYDLSNAEITRLTNSPSESDSDPKYSPDSNSIVFISSGEATGIKLLDLQSNQENYLTPNGATDVFPSWNPSGNKIVFSSQVEKGFELFIMNRDGSERTQITDTKFANNFYPVWSASDIIYFESNKDTRYQIFSVKVDGTDLKRISHLGKKNRKFHEMTVTE
ncbi:MAG: hypothetical protein Tsb0034_11570 [Ekhidna sp.]